MRARGRGLGDLRPRLPCRAGITNNRWFCSSCNGPQGCPDGWTRLSTGCYRVVAGPSGAGLSKEEAGRECETRGGRLAGVESREEREAVAAWYRDTQQPNCYQRASVLWLGIHNHTK